MKDFLCGISYIISGCRKFYSDARYWKYTIIPFLCVALFYTFLFWAVIYFFNLGEKYMIEFIYRQFPEFLHGIVSVVKFIMQFARTATIILLLSTTISALYGIFGGLFFDCLVEYHEKKEFGITAAPFSFFKMIRYAFSSLIFGITSAFKMFIFFIFSLFFPLAGQILLIIVTGYTLSISCMVAPANNCGLTISKLRKIAGKRKFAVAGFGIAAYILMMIPFAALFLLPGLVLGGSELFNRELKHCIDTEKGSL